MITNIQPQDAHKTEAQAKERLQRVHGSKKTNTMQTTIINFGGFYHSIHSENIDNVVENLICTDNEDNFDQKIYDEFNWQEAHKKYCIEYLDKFEDWLTEELELKETPKIEFKELISPRFYNYTTDKIEASISEENSKEIKNALLLSDYAAEFAQYVAERTTSGPGYIHFYTYKEVMQNKEGIFIDFALEFMTGKYNSEGLLNSIHEVNVYEAIM
jgi:hypothetical protein